MRGGGQDVVALLTRPSTWVAMAVLAIPFSSAGGASASAAVTPADLLLVVGIAVAALRVLRDEAALRAVRSVPGAALLLLGTATLAVSLAGSQFPQGLVGSVRFVQLFCLVPLAVLVALRTRRDAEVVLGALVGLAVVEGAVGVWQFLTGSGAGIGGASIRAVGTFGAYNIGALGELCGLGVVVALAAAVVLRGRVRWWAVAVAVGLVAPLLFSLTRGAWLAAAVGVVVVLSRGLVSRLAATLVCLTVAAGVAAPVVLASGGELADRLTSITTVDSAPDQSVTDRVSLWGAATRMALDHPWAGTGPRGFAEHRDAYADLSLLGSSDISIGGDFQQVALESPHNFYLLVASEQGLVVAVLYAVVFLLLGARGLARASRPRHDVSTAVALAGTGVLAYELVAMVSGDLGGPGSILVSLAVGLAAWAAADTDLDDDSGPRQPAAPQPAARTTPGVATAVRVDA